MHRVDAGPFAVITPIPTGGAAGRGSGLDTGRKALLPVDRTSPSRRVQPDNNCGIGSISIGDADRFGFASSNTLMLLSTAGTVQARTLTLGEVAHVNHKHGYIGRRRIGSVPRPDVSTDKRS
jgi:hypothetical protein